MALKGEQRESGGGGNNREELRGNQEEIGGTTMNGMEIFLIGLFCGAYGMFTLMGMVILAKRDRARMGKNRVLGINGSCG